jgi:hypothetical protein
MAALDGCGDAGATTSFIIIIIIIIIVIIIVIVIVIVTESFGSRRRERLHSIVTTHGWMGYFTTAFGKVPDLFDHGIGRSFLGGPNHQRVVIPVPGLG